MNALANSQLEELKKFLGGPGHPVSVTFARYTGQEKPEEREQIKNNPPDILLTNFMMLELLMTRQSELDKAVIENCRGLKFIVLDELHTYRGRQGADVAMLMRRLRARVGDPNHPPICIGTSATMASEGIEDDRNQIVAGVASRLFGTVIARDVELTQKSGRRVFVVPGGGPTDKAIEAIDQRHSLAPDTHHRACARAQDQTGLMICDPAFSRILTPCENSRRGQESGRR